MVEKAIFHREKDRKTHHTPPAFGRKTFMCQNKAHQVFSREKCLFGTKIKATFQLEIDQYVAAV